MDEENTMYMYDTMNLKSAQIDGYTITIYELMVTTMMTLIL